MRTAILLGLVVLGLAGCRRPAETLPAKQRPGSSARSADSAAAPSPGSGFDFYLLNLSWSPEFCHAHPTAAECARHSTFVLHGLWPERADGTYPEDCSNAAGPADPSQYSDIYPDPGLVEHEWKAHGTCSGLSPAAYFAAARAADRAITLPPTLQQVSHTITLTPDRIASLFAASNPSISPASLAISCSNNYLSAVEVCLSPTLQPVACGAVRSCAAKSVRISPP